MNVRSAAVDGVIGLTAPRLSHHAGPRGLRRRRRARCAVAALSAIAVAGCSLAPPKVREAEFDPAIGRRIVVVPGRSEPKVALPDVAVGKTEGAARSAAGIGVTCLVSAMPAAASCTAAGPLAGVCAAVPVLMVAICGSATLGGAVYGATAADPAGVTRRNLEALTAQVRAENTLQRLLAVAVAERGQSLPGEQVMLDGDAAGTADYRLELDVKEVGLTGVSLVNDPVSVGLRAHARLVRVRDGRTVNEDEYRVEIGAHPLGDWIAGGAARFSSALESAYRRLGAHVYDQLVLLQPVPAPALKSAGVLVGAIGLAPEYPRMTGTWPVQGTPVGDLMGEWPEVPTPTPTLRWEHFPTAAAEKKAPGLVARMRRIRYDLVIARESNSASGDIVYAREGLTVPMHTVEQPLEPGARYFWSVRARFELDGRERVTDWSITNAYAAVRQAPPGVYTYRFRVNR